MKALYVVLIAAAVVAVRVALFRRRRRRAAGQGIPEPSGRDRSSARSEERPAPRRGGATLWPAVENQLGDVGLVAGREIRERVRGRIFRVGTLLMLVAVGLAIIIPTLHKSGGPTPQSVAVVGALSPDAHLVVLSAARVNKDKATFVHEGSLASAKADLRSGKVDLAIVDSDEILLDEPASASTSPADSGLVQYVAEYLGVLQSYEQAGLTVEQAAQVSHAKPVAVRTLVAGSKGNTVKASSIIGVVLLFVMLTQYCTWTLIGVMQEKSSRVVEVLLAMVRPLQLLGGKVVGIGVVALGQAALIVSFALALGAAVGSNFLKGAAPMALLAELVWLVVGYGFYCWVYAAAGSTAERQDQVQTLALPLSVPMLLGYIYSITVASSGAPSLFFKVLAYLPPTAPFCMSTLVALSQVTWWQFVASVIVSLAGTALTAVFAARIYRRAVLRTGGRVHLRELVGRPAR
jgi:ABC-2 type transport system permease protein